MLESLIDAFRQAVVNFRTELRRGELPQVLDEHLRAMARDVARTALRCDSLRGEVRAARLEAETEEREADTCARRLELARKISDEETARVAAGFEARHRRRRDLLKQKAELMERELRERESDLAEMRDSLREALRLRNPAPPVSGPDSD